MVTSQGAPADTGAAVSAVGLHDAAGDVDTATAAALASADTGSHFCIFRNTYPAIGVCAAAKRGDHTAGDIDGAAGTEISAANASAVAVASGGDCSTLNIGWRPV